MLKVLDVDGAVRRVKGGWVATGQPWGYDAERYARVAAERAGEQRAMLGYLPRRPAAWSSCGASSTIRQLSRGALRQLHRSAPWSDARSPAAGTAAASDRLLRPGVEITPRKMWPTGMKDLAIDVAGKIPADPSQRSRAGPPAC